LFEELDYSKKALTVCFFIIYNLQTVLISYIDIFNFLAAVAIYDITRKLDAIMCSKVDKNIGFLLTCYGRMLKDVKNAINSRVMLALYIQTLTFLTSTCVDIKEDSNWLNRVYMFGYYNLYAFTLILAAEANATVSLGLKNFILYLSKHSLRIKIHFGRLKSLKGEFGSFTEIITRERHNLRKLLNTF